MRPCLNVALQEPNLNLSSLHPWQRHSKQTNRVYVKPRLIFDNKVTILRRRGDRVVTISRSLRSLGTS